MVNYRSSFTLSERVVKKMDECEEQNNTNSSRQLPSPRDFTSTFHVLVGGGSRGGGGGTGPLHGPGGVCGSGDGPPIRRVQGQRRAAGLSRCVGSKLSDGEEGGTCASQLF